ncbi:MAG: T9SS type A sorting domain-containing protein [candidate division Zixibacteria bacterium]|nr:T9SS type A sorting domain-containing protein [candidate division Zixibacteria bacterium]
MNKAIFLAAIFFTFFTSTLLSEQLSAEQDAALYQQIMIWRGEADISLSSDSLLAEIGKCGTPLAMSVAQQVKYASPKTQQAWLAFLNERYEAEAPETYGSPKGYFLIHYATEGVHAARTDENLGINPTTGVPEYVESTAVIFDYVYEYQMDTLGYDDPPTDDFYPEGGDARFDVYLVDLATVGWGNAYGVTFPDRQFGTGGQYSTAFQALDNDYYEIEIYAERPLDAVRVTAGHEFFHVTQFGYDALEFEDRLDRHHWLEMSAVWMEEEIYDEVNDYYNYLPAYLSYIHRSLYTHTPGLYQYGAVLWPQYLTDKWGRDIIRDIWDKCEAELGPNVIENGFSDAIEQFSGGEYTFGEALSELYIWNYFTGLRAKQGFGFEEASEYIDSKGDPIQVPDSVREGSEYFHNIVSFNSYPFEFDLGTDEFKYFPQGMGAYYVRFTGTDQLDSSLTINFKGLPMDRVARIDFDITWNNRIVAYNPHIPTQPVYIDPEVYAADTSEIVLEKDLLEQYDEIVLVLSPFAIPVPNIDYIGPCTFTLNVADTAEPIETVIISDAYPNPYVLSQSGGQDLYVEVMQPEPQPIKMQVYTLSGEKIIEKEVETNRNKEILGWNGLNEAGDMVASGMYLIYVSAGDVNKVLKVAVIE